MLIQFLFFVFWAFYWVFFFASCLSGNLMKHYILLRNCKYVCTAHAHVHTHNFTHSFYEMMGPLKPALDPHVVILPFTLGRLGDRETLVSLFMQKYNFMGTLLTYFMYFTFAFFLCKYRIKWKFGVYC